MYRTNAIREAVIFTLKQNFPAARVYGEEIAQGFQEPCFFVKLFPVEQDQELGTRYKRYHSFDIHYFNDADDPNEDMHDRADQLYQAMEIIEMNSKSFRGKKMKHEINDGVLHFFVDYDFHIVKVKEETLMQTLQFGGVRSD